ncbi:retinol dehydrogenase 7 [Biomphalaria glabrata]|nr:retinol dehydrogenase 7 [Biomphalaria glabrata]
MTDLWYALLLLVITLFLIEYLRRRLTVGGYRDKYVLVTGCDSGFGQRLTTRLDNLGFKVFAGCLTEDGRQYLSKSCSKNVVPFLLDVRSNESIQSALDLVKQNLPKDIGLWGLVNNAGIVGNMAVSELCSKSDYLACFDVNLFGLIEMTRTFLPLLRRSKGRVVNTSSLLARLAIFAPVYTLSKCGVEVYSDFVR